MPRAPCWPTLSGDPGADGYYEHMQLHRFISPCSAAAMAAIANTFRAIITADGGDPQGVFHSGKAVSVPGRVKLPASILDRGTMIQCERRCPSLCTRMGARQCRRICSRTVRACPAKAGRPCPPAAPRRGAWLDPL